MWTDCKLTFSLLDQSDLTAGNTKKSETGAAARGEGAALRPGGEKPLRSCDAQKDCRGSLAMPKKTAAAVLRSCDAQKDCRGRAGDATPAPGATVVACERAR